MSQKNIYESFDKIFAPNSGQIFREVIRQEVREALADILVDKKRIAIDFTLEKVVQ